jgi:WW domain
MSSRALEKAQTDGKWICVSDPSTGKKYYYNSRTKETSWKKPAGFKEPDWIETQDPKSNRRYYYNRKTKETSWKKPKLYVPMSKKKLEIRKAATTTMSRSASEVSVATAATVASDDDLANWRKTSDKRTGRTYWYNTKTKATTWKDPAKRGKGSTRRRSGTPTSSTTPRSSAKATAGGPASSSKAADKPTSGSLDGHWRKRVDPDTGKDYYYNVKTKERSWLNPQQSKIASATLSSAASTSGSVSTTSMAGLDEKRDDVLLASNQPVDRYDDDSDGASEFGTDSVFNRNRNAASVITRDAGDGKEVDQFNMEIDTFFEAFKLVSKTTDETLLAKRLQLLDIEEPENDARVPKVVNLRKGIFYQLIRILKRFPKNVEIVKLTSHLLRKYGSLEEYIIKAVENDIVGKTINVLGVHMNNKSIVGDCVILLGNLSLNEYVKELIRMEEGVKVISLIMVHPEHINDPDIIDKCCYCLANLAVENLDNVRDIVEGGALKHVLASMAKFKDNSDVMDSAMATVANLCAIQSSDDTDTTRQALTDVGVVRSLVETMKSQQANATVLVDCLHALGNLGLHKDTVPVLLSDGTVSALTLTIKSHHNDPQVLALAISVLSNLSAFSSPTEVKSLVSEGAVEVVVSASRAHPLNSQIQLAFFGAIANLAKAVNDPGSPIDKQILDCVHDVMKVMRSLKQKRDILAKGLKLIQRIASQEHRTKKLVALGVHEFLTDVLSEQVRANNPKLIKDTLTVVGVLANEITATELAHANLIKVVNVLLVDLVDDNVLVEAAIKTLTALASHQAAAVRVAEYAVAAIVRAGLRHRDKPSFVNRIASLFGTLSMYNGPMDYIIDADAGRFMLELLQEHSHQPAQATKIITSLTNMMVAHERFGRVLKVLHGDSTVRPLAGDDHGNVALRTAAKLFLARLKDILEHRAPGRKFSLMSEEQQHAYLQNRFNIPEVDRKIMNWMCAGQTLRLYTKQGSDLRHVCIGDDAKFLYTRKPDENEFENKYSVRIINDVAEGKVTKPLMKKGFLGLGHVAKEECSFAIIADTYTLSLEAATEEDRTQWIDGLKEVARFRKELVSRRTELTVEEAASYG